MGPTGLEPVTLCL